MRKLTLLTFVAVCQLASAGESEKKTHELNQWNQLEARYKIHSGNTAYNDYQVSQVTQRLHDAILAPEKKKGLHAKTCNPLILLPNSWCR